MKKFKVIDKTYRHISLTGFERDLAQERIIDFSGVDLSEERKYALIDDFCENFNAICEDERGDFYEVLFVNKYDSKTDKSVDIPVIYRKCRK